MKRPSAPHLMNAACVFALVALALIVWSLVDPRPIPVIVAMSVGQVIGTLSFATFLFVVLGDLRARYKAVTAKGAPSEAAHRTPGTPPEPPPQGRPS